jgi:hypothetical protein
VHIIGYVILVFGVVGILLGLYGLLMPIARRRGLTLKLPRIRLPSASPPDEYGDQLEDVLAELEGSNFRSSVFEVPPPPAAPDASAPRVIQVAPGAWTAPAETQDTLRATLVAEQEMELPELEEAPLPEANAAGDPMEMESVPPENTSAEAEAQVEAEAEEEASAEAAPEGANADMMALFSAVSEKSVMPEALRDAIPAVTMEELLAEARAIRQMIGTAESSATNAA